MIRFNPAPAFDFDEWVALHAADPVAFEARRNALLAIEIARGGDGAGSARAALDGLEAVLAGLDAASRAAAARDAVAQSARELSLCLETLCEALRQPAGAVSGSLSAPGIRRPPDR